MAGAGAGAAELKGGVGSGTGPLFKSASSDDVEQSADPDQG
jgi:hypothetical protein